MREQGVITKYDIKAKHHQKAIIRGSYNMISFGFEANDSVEMS